MNYDDFKKKMDGLDESKRQQVANLMWNSQIDATYKNYWDQYQSEMNNSQPKTSQASNSFSSPETTYQNQQQNQPTYQPQQQQQQVQQQPTYDPNEKLDTNMFGATDGKVKVQEGTAKYTGKADFSLNSDARMQEITNNLNAYWQNNPEYFSDRDTYNKMFNYNERSNEQKALLDSYWKKKEGMDTAQRYTTWDSIVNGMNDAEITNDQLNYIKEYSPEAYRERQQKQQDEVNLRIANLATPADPTANAELFQSISKKLNLDPWDSYQIYDNWTSMCERLGVFSDSEKLSSYQNQLNQNHQKMEQIMSRYANSAGGTVSDALAAARMQKALAPYQQVEANLQNSYQILLNGRNSNLALANQSVQVMQAQAQEDQRIFNQRLQGLGFAMQTASYRTPEQQAQLQLTTQAISNEMNLLQQSKQQDLNLYNQYAGAKLQNQLQNELTDLSVSDPKQLRANLNNALTSYYEQYGDIIQRSQAQVVDDIINYANEKGISVAQAMTENFIKPLQWKAEYKQKVANAYWMLSKQSVATINGKSVIMTTNPNGSISYQYLEDPSNAVSKAKPYDTVDPKSMSLLTGMWYPTLWDFLQTKEAKDGSYWWQCGAFVNDYLQKIGLGRYYDNDLSTKINSVNQDTPTVWSIAVFDYNLKSSDWINHWHVWIVTQVYDDWSFQLLDSNRDWDEITHSRRIYPWSTSLKWFFNPSQWANTSLTNTGVASWNEEDIPMYNKYLAQKLWTTDLARLEATDPDFRAKASAYKKSQDAELTPQVVKLIENLEDLKNMDRFDYMNAWYWDNGVPWTKGALYRGKFNFVKGSNTLQNLINMKGQGATFGALSDSELDILKNSSDTLNLALWYDDFMDTVNEMIQTLSRGAWITTTWPQTNEEKYWYSQFSQNANVSSGAGTMAPLQQQQIDQMSSILLSL